MLMWFATLAEVVQDVAGVLYDSLVVPCPFGQNAVGDVIVSVS
jgi:hypothetical protein